MSNPFSGPVAFVLASQSPGRAQVARSAGLDPIVRVSHVDEEAILKQFVNPHGAQQAAQKVCALAQAKARAVVAELTSIDFSQTKASRGLVVGCDSMLETDGALVGKPHTPKLALERIRAQSGKSTCLHTGHAAYLVSIDHASGSVSTVDHVVAQAETVVHFGDISEAEARAYVNTGEPLEVAGAFTIDGLGGPFIRGVEGDPHAVVGLSLPLLRSMARQLGVAWPSLWAARLAAERR
ncbi:Maf family protein [Gleimia hominis]|uniref:Maf family protein n=1 Tax=Gleimia hominis TaxID=595468 RepID=UPI000C808140|nr:Maf family protein [Gleimia hominis]WIK63707.1 Maf family protein [Gleimia hominis]